MQSLGSNTVWTRLITLFALSVHLLSAGMHILEVVKINEQFQRKLFQGKPGRERLLSLIFVQKKTR
jgi:hypothetical protein